MLLVTLHAPEEFGTPAVDALTTFPYACNIVRSPGAAVKPDGDLISFMVPREAVSEVLDALACSGVHEGTSTITIAERQTVLGELVSRAERDAAGSPSDAFVWPVLRASTSTASEFSITYAALMVLATMLAAIGLYTSSSVLIVGAMILGPEFGALAHMCTSALARDARGAMRATWQLALGFSVAIATTGVLTWTADVTGLVASSELSTEFEQAIVSPTWIGFATACIAGIAGVLTLTSARGEALIGVLVSVTTIPAAAEMSLGLATLDIDRLGNGAATLVLNLVGIVLAGAATLMVYRIVGAGPLTTRLSSSHVPRRR